jgi:hypothetical protein
MAEIRPASKVKLLAGLLARDPQWLDAAGNALAEAFGPIDLTSDTWPHEFTDYYTEQMGAPLRRRFVTFESPIDPGCLAAVKRRTNEIEAELARSLAADVPRPVNIDPGYVTAAKLVLASCKDYSHRVYLGDGVYGEVTLAFVGGLWQAQPWTYPDFRTAGYQAFFTRVRDRLRGQLRGGG